MFTKIKHIFQEYNLFDKFKFTLGSYVFLKVLTTNFIKIERIKETNSMSPSINPKLNDENISLMNSDYLVTSLFFERFFSYKKNRLVLMQHPEKDEMVARLLVAKPGEWIKAKNLNVFHKVPEGHFWVECLKGEDDSSNWGPVSYPLIKGRVILLIRPFKKIISGRTIKNNMKKKLKVKDRFLDDNHFEIFSV